MLSNDTEYSQETHPDAYKENCLSMCSEAWGFGAFKTG